MTIKASTRKKTTKKASIVKVEQAHLPDLYNYVNSTNINCFTDQGKVAPDKTIMLTEEQALEYKELTLV